MDLTNNQRWRCGLFAMIALGACPSFAAEDDMEAVDREIQNGVVRIQAVRQAAPQFDRWVYNQDAARGRKEIENRMDLAILDLSTKYGLTDAQVAKLKMAAGIELTRFYRDVDELLRRYEATQGDLTEAKTIELEVLDLGARKHALFGPDSFFSKASAKIPTVEQLARYQAEVDGWKPIRHRSDVERAVREIERYVVLRRLQHEPLVQLLVQEISPVEVTSKYDDDVVRFRLSQLPENKLKPLFDEEQWPKVCRILEGFRKSGRLLVEHGLIDKSEAELAKAEDGIGIDAPADATVPNQPVNVESLGNPNEN